MSPPDVAVAVATPSRRTGELHRLSSLRYTQANEIAVGGSYGDGEPLEGGIQEAGKPRLEALGKSRRFARSLLLRIESA